MAVESPFGRKTRVKVLEKYFETAGLVTADNAWEHVYKNLLWLDERTKLAHIYDSNHMQPGGTFHSRAQRFTDALVERLDVPRPRLGDNLDFLFQGCVQEMKRQEAARRESGAADDEPEEGAPDEPELVGVIADIMKRSLTVPEGDLPELARKIEKVAKDFFTIGNKRKNALGEGFEDLLEMLLLRVSGVPVEMIRVRKNVSDLPGFRNRATTSGQRKEREPKPDIAIVNGNRTCVITTAKWSMRQDRETQFASEYEGYKKARTQESELRYFLVTNEFDSARLHNVAVANPDSGRGYHFHTIFHMNVDLLREAHGERMDERVDGWIKTKRIQSLSDFLGSMKQEFGPTDPAPPAQKKRKT